MTTRPADQDADKHGYLSPAHKKTFTITTGILGVVFFFAQFAVPFLMMLVIMPSAMYAGAFSFKDAHLSHAALWNDKIWYPETEVGPGMSGQTASVLMTVSVDRDHEPETGGTVALTAPWLLNGTDRLWLIASNGIGYSQGGEVMMYQGIRPLGDISRPFLRDGMPAVIENRPDGLAMMVFRDRDWREETTFSLSSEQKPLCVCDLQVLSESGRLHLFLKYGNSIYYREGLQSAGDNGNAWQVVSSSVGNWQAFLVNGEPVVFLLNAADISGAIAAYRNSGGRWETFGSYRSGLATDFGVFQVKGTQRVALVTQGFPGSLGLQIVENRHVVRKAHYGSPFPFPKSFMLVMFIPQVLTMALPLFLAIIFSVLMRKHRTTFHQTEAGRKPYASLTRRALAQIVDAAIMGAPVIVLTVSLMPSFLNGDMTFFGFVPGFMHVIALMAGGLIWVLLCIVVFSIMEGARGVTPGKWIFGIRVFGVDLRYCGFWRALLRNLLMFVDGFFNFMVGVIIIALSENWQRVGDMAARTVVIHVRGES